MIGDTAAGECHSNLQKRTDWLPPVTMFGLVIWPFRINGNKTF